MNEELEKVKGRLNKIIKEKEEKKEMEERKEMEKNKKLSLKERWKKINKPKKDHKIKKWKGNKSKSFVKQFKVEKQIKNIKTLLRKGFL